jgi:uncharacterized protein (DUF1684 family)
MNCGGKTQSDLNKTLMNPSELSQFRMSKDSQFKTDKDSPIPEEIKPTFEGLKYYPESKEFIFTAKIIKFEKQDTVKFRTSKEDITRFMIKYCKLEFKLLDSTYSLLGFLPMKNGQVIDPPELFVPFFDETNGKDTYEAGRYLDFPIDSKETLILDFNYAYNPYCAYNHKYSCARVPEQNFIQLKIEAGEKIFKSE